MRKVTGYLWAMERDLPDAAPRLARWGWITVAVNLAVILWGAWVRASGSGAGCGNHWPLCDGQVLPLAPDIKMLTEFAHRATSGMALLLVVGMVVAARRTFPAGHRVRRAAWVSLLLIVIEALLGAGLVKFGLVDRNDSLARAAVLGLHLVNTQLLLAALALTAWYAGGRPGIRLGAIGPRGWWLLAGTLALLVVGLTGAVASLGDTLFPARTLREGLAQDLDPTSHLLLRLRVLHPTLAILAGSFAWTLGMLMPRWRGVDGRGRREGRWLATMVGVQWAIGGISLLLLVPVALQLIHLLSADVLWLAWVVFVATMLGQRTENGERRTERERRAENGESLFSVLRSQFSVFRLSHSGASRTRPATALAASASNTVPAPSSR